jgi:hypothetical protein
MSILPLKICAIHKEKLKYAVESSPSIQFPKAKNFHQLHRIEERTLALAKSCWELATCRGEYVSYVER